MTSAVLQSLLDRMGAVQCGRSLVAPCPICQPGETDSDAFKLYAKSGDRYPIVIHCHRCMVPKPQTAEDKGFNRTVTRTIWGLLDAPVDDLYTPMDPEDIEELWSGVRGGVRSWVEGDGDRADDATLHGAYSALLDGLSLSDRHRRWLQRGGLDADWCFSRGYRTAVGGEVGEGEAVPGLCDGKWLTRPGALLIPVRDQWGRIGAVKQRLSEGRVRYRHLSGGAKGKMILHVPLGVNVAEAEELWVTEGERKADAVYFHKRCPVVGVPGVGSVGLLQRYAHLPVVLCFDRDDPGRRAADVVAAMWGRERPCRVGDWDAPHKGIDDALAAGAEVRVGEWGGAENKISSPPTKSLDPPPPFVRGQKLKDSQVLDYLRWNGPTLRSEINAYPEYISKLIRDGQLRMWKSNKGQVLEVVDLGDARR